MLRMLCGESELQEHDEVVAIGDRVERVAGALGGEYFGAPSDDVRWQFDRYARL